MKLLSEVISLLRLKPFIKDNGYQVREINSLKRLK